MSLFGEKLQTNAAAFLVAGATSTATTLYVDSVDLLPEVPFRASIGTELVIVTAKSSTDSSLIVFRGVEATAQASHSYGDAVINVLTAEGVNRHVLAAFPQANRDPNDVGTWSWGYQGPSASVVEGGGLISLSVPPSQTNSEYSTARVVSTKASGFEAAFTTVSIATAQYCGIGWQDGTGKVQSLEVIGDVGTNYITMRITEKSSLTATSASYTLSHVVIHAARATFVKFHRSDSGTVRIYCSVDGFGWVLLDTRVDATFEPDRIAFIGRGRSTATGQSLSLLYHLRET